MRTVRLRAINRKNGHSRLWAESVLPASGDGLTIETEKRSERTLKPVPNELGGEDCYEQAAGNVVARTFSAAPCRLWKGGRLWKLAEYNDQVGQCPLRRRE